MAAPSCIPHIVARQFATEVVDKLSDKQLKDFGITKENRDETIEAIRVLVEHHVNGESDPEKKDQMLQNVDGFISDLVNHFTVVKVLKDQYEEAERQYRHFFESLEKLGIEGTSRIDSIEIPEDDALQEEAVKLEAFLQSYNKVVSYKKEYYDPDTKKKIKSISYILMEPEESEEASAQEKAVNTIRKIQDLSKIEIKNSKGKLDYVSKDEEIPSGWRRTGNYLYDGKIIRAKSVSKDVHGDEEYTGPVLASHIGNSVDAVGRMVFDKTSKLYNDQNKLVGNEELQDIIDNDLRGVFTVAGLKNLIKDFQKLEEQLKEKWGDNIQIITEDIRFFAQQADGTWIQGKPDMLVVDGKGVVHTLDFKTSKMTDIKGYMTIFHDENEQQYHTGENYGKQISRYIKQQQSYGLNVEEQPYVILVDTWYDGSDTVASRKKGQKRIYETEGDTIGLIDEDGNLTMSLGKYAERNPTSREELLSSERAEDKVIYYMEPRLHVDYAEEQGFSEELAALRGEEDIPFDSEVSYEQQWNTLTKDEQDNLQWLFNAKPVPFKTAQDVVTLSDNDIESNQGLITSQEIQDVADFLMYRVSRIISDLQKGVSYDTIAISQPVNANTPSPLKGKSRAAIIKLVGVDNLINIAFDESIKSRYKEDFPTEEEYNEGKEDNGYFTDDIEYEFENEEDYQQQKRMSDKAKWLIDHKEQLIISGSAKLIALENSIIPVKDKNTKFNPSAPSVRLEVTDNEPTGETGDNESNQSFADLYLEGITNIEAWMLGQRNYSPKASLAQEIKRMFEDIDMLDSNGKLVRDPYGWGFPMALDATQAIQATLDACKNCETIDEMIQAMKDLAKNPQNRWINQILDRINSDDNLKKKFYRHFRKDALNYSIAQVKFDKKTGKRIVEVRIINKKSAEETITQSLATSFRNGNVGSYTINGVTFSIVHRDNGTGHNVLTRMGKLPIARQIEIEADEWYKAMQNLYKEGRNTKNISTTDYVIEQIQTKKIKIKHGDKEKTIIQALTDLLNGIGITVPQEVVLNTCLGKIGKGDGKRSNASALFRYIKLACNKLQTMEGKKEIPEGLKGNDAGRGYFPILSLVADHVQEFVEASVYQDGKTYFSYTNPSRLGHIIRNLKNAMGDPDKFEKYIKDQYGRYTGWFMDVQGNEYLCDWVRQLADIDSSAARQALEHKVELSYIGNHYRNLGALGFQLSILHNYFGSRDDNSLNNDWRWFAMPTMSNKPTNEFIRMLKYKDRDEIIDKVLMNTFKQEMNRMADVLYHYTHHRVATDQIDLTDKKLEKAGWSEEEIQGLKDRINSQSVTVADIIRLSKVTSGAKFHFLWYLNGMMNNEELPEFGTRIAERLNILLTPDGETKDAKLSESNEVDTLSMVREVIKISMEGLKDDEGNTIVEGIVEKELQNMKRIGLFETETKKINGKEVQVLKYQEEFDGKLGEGSTYEEAVKNMENKLRDFIWQDIAANINIIQITGGDLAYYGNAVNYQKRIAQVHSPGLKLMHDDRYDDGYLRSVHISDEMIRDEIKHNTETALTEYMEKSGLTGTAKDDYKKMISIILSGLTDTEATDGQSYSSPSSIRKKLALQGEWDDEKEKAYQAISKGDFNINHLGVMLQPSKPFVTSDMAKYSGSTTMELRKTPLQDKNSEYLIVLAEALARGSGKRSKLVAICDFMEDTHFSHIKRNEDGTTTRTGYRKSGIDTCHFASVNKVGKSGIIDLSEFDRMFEESGLDDEDYNRYLTEYMLDHVRRKAGDYLDQEDLNEEERLISEGKLKREEAIYNNQYVDTIPVEDYIIQQEVPAHLLEHQQLYGSQIRILGISDITPGTEFDVNGEKMSDEELVNEYKELHAQNIRESFEDLMAELGLDKLVKDGKLVYETINELPTDERNQVYKNLEFLLQKELSKDAKYGLDMRRACSLQYDDNGNVRDFAVPLMDPIQSRRIQELINSIIKKSINKQRITGGPVVQTTAYDSNLHIRFKHKNGGLLLTREEYEGWEPATHQTYEEYVKENQAGIAYFECYMPVPNATLERLMLKPDGSMMSYEELFDHEENGKIVKGKLPSDVQKALTEVIGYRIPTEDKYSMIPLKIMGFVPKAAGQVIMMPQEITYLTGSDFDIDKMYIMMKAFRVNKDVSKRDKQGRDDVNALLKSYVAKKGQAATFPGIQRVIQQTIDNFNHIIDGDEGISWETGITKDQNWEKAKNFIEWYKDNVFKTVLSEYPHYTQEELDDLKKKGIEVSRKELREGRNNRLLDLQWAVLTNEDTASKMLNPGNFNDQKKVGRIIRILKSGAVDTSYQQLTQMDIDELDNLLENANPHNTTLPSSKIYFQRQNMQGTQMVGIFANNNVSHAFMSFQKVGIDLYKKYDNTFMFDGVTIGDPDRPTVLDPQKGFNGQLISKTIASFLAASVDTAKDPTLADMNVNTFTGGVAMVLARLGFDTAAIGLFLSQPVIMRLSDLYFRKSTEGFYSGDTALEELASEMNMKKDDLRDTEGIKDSTLSIENFIEHLNDTDYDDEEDNFQKRVLKGFYSLYQIAHDLQELTFCTKFNSVSNAVGPTIADTMEDQDRVERFINKEDSVFYIPSSDNDPMGFTDPHELIANDPILSAFYDTTVGPDGASERIFKNFFPHYFQGFQNVKQYFQENFLGGKKINSKLYNQLLNEYLYYLMTYQNEEDGFMPTLPYTWQQKERLVSKLVKDFNEVLKIKGRKPNMILDQSLGGNCLRVRSADEFLAVDALQFNNSQLNADGQQKVKNAWSDLITMNDPNLSEDDNMRLIKFGVDLFFYNLMRNGFTFSPKTMMTLASVIVRYNATYDRGFNNYILGLRNLKNVDEYLMNGADNMTAIKQFCSQFIRNHANNGQLIPKVDSQDSHLFLDTKDNSIVEFKVPLEKENELYYIGFSKDTDPKPFVTILKKEGKTLTSELYELEETLGGDKTTMDGNGNVVIRYKKSNRLGLTNNFIEYDANDTLSTSFFEEIRNNSADDMDDEVASEGQSKDEQEQTSGMRDTSKEEPQTFTGYWNSNVMPVLKSLKGPQSGKEGKEYRLKLKKAMQEADDNSEFAKAFNNLLEAKQSERQGLMDKLNDIFKKENKC